MPGRRGRAFRFAIDEVLMIRIPLCLAGAAVATVVAFAPAGSSAQPHDNWTWPARARNLKILPRKTPPDQLRGVMTGFTRALGVKCSHCHVGEAGRPRSAYDFASDANPKKRIARGMMKLTKEVNEELGEISELAHSGPRSSRVQVQCITCHRGLPQPRTLSSTLSLAYEAGGADSAITAYQTLRRGSYDAGSYDFREPSLEELGEYAYQKNDTSGALRIFELNMRQFPESGNVYARMAQLYLARGDTARAITNYQRALNVDPGNSAGAEGVRRLRRQP